MGVAYLTQRELDTLYAVLILIIVFVVICIVCLAIRCIAACRDHRKTMHPLSLIHPMLYPAGSNEKA